MKYSVAELFYSIQGEGANAGRAALFIRLAGCCVGRVPTEEDFKVFKPAEKHTICATYAGQPFVCDTNYTKWKDFEHHEIPVELLALSAHCKLVFITGGEPLLWNLEPLVNTLVRTHYEVWIETSGVKLIPASIKQARIIVSPKAWYQAAAVASADHLKILVHAGTNPEDLEEFEEFPRAVYLQPIEDADARLSAANLERAIELVQERPQFRLGVQLHKYLRLP